MRAVIWLVLLAVVAVVAASVLGANEGLVSIYWAPWRVDVSLNLFVLMLVLGVSCAWVVAQALDALLGLPRRAREWRALQRERAANAALREALAHSFAGRYSRAHKAAQRAIDIQRQTPELLGDAEFTVLAQLLGAASLHRLQDRSRRDQLLQQALDTSDRLGGSGRPLSEGAHLIAAEWAVDDREPARAMTLLGALPPGASRRTRALRLKLQAARAARQPLEALRTARMLAKHQGFTPEAAQGLLRSLAIEVLSESRDADQLRRNWQTLDAADRRDPLVVAHAATLAANFDAASDGRAWLRPAWERLQAHGDAERLALADALVRVRRGMPGDWLPVIEMAQQLLPQDSAVAHAAGLCLLERSLWGHGRRALEFVAGHAQALSAHRRSAWQALGALAERESDLERAAMCYRAAALDGAPAEA